MSKSAELYQKIKERQFQDKFKQAEKQYLKGKRWLRYIIF